MNPLMFTSKRNDMNRISLLAGIRISYFYIIGCMRNDKIYVGVTYNPKSRYLSHICALRGNRHINKDLQEDFNRYGEDSFVFKVIDASTCGRRYEKEKRLMEALKTYDPEHGYNQNDVYFKSKKKDEKE